MQVIEHPEITAVAFAPNKNIEARLAFSIGYNRITPSHVDLELITAGKYYAMRLARVLGALKTYNPGMIYSFVSILEPYMGTTQELNLDMPPISTTRVIARVIDRGKAEPEFDFE
jgi:hypothetical protein